MALQSFKLQKILNYIQNQKRLIAWGKKQQQNCLIIISPKKINLSNIIEAKKVELIFSNDIYKTYTAQSFTQFQIQIIQPATEKHYKKYIKKTPILLYQNKQQYQQKYPKILAESKHNQWIYNIIQGKSQADRILYAQPGQNGFIIIPDSKFTDSDPNKMHLLAIVNNRQLYTIRQLSNSHIQMLKNIQKKARQIIKNTYGLNFYRQFLHYPPTFYHLHIHFMNIQIMKRSTQIDRCHELNLVIQNIELKSDYYKEITLNIISQQKE